MKNPNALVHLLIISDKNTQMNRLLSNLRQTGLPLRASGLNSKSRLHTHFNAKQWDLIICFENANIPVEDALVRRNQLELDIPLLFISDKNSSKDPLRILKLGAHKVIPETQMASLLSYIERESSNYQLKKKNLALKLSLKDLENRYQRLLNDADNAFCYIQEGKHTYCNQAYAQLFGHANTSSIIGTPLLNLISAADKVQIKKLLSRQIKQDTKVIVRGQPRKANHFEIELILSPIEINNLNCLQLSVKVAKGNAEYAETLQSIQSQDLLTGLTNKPTFLNQTEAAIRQALKLNTFSSLLIIQLDNFIDVLSIIGKPNANIVIADIGQFLLTLTTITVSAARLGAHEFGIILYNDRPEKAQELANHIKSKINNHITKAALPSLELSCSIGIAVINGTALDSEDLIAKAKGNLNAQIPIPSSDKHSLLAETKPIEMLSYINEALLEKRFALRFQAIVNIKGDGFACYEVLVRMLDDNNNEILPVAFLPLANMNGLGEAIDKLVISLALDELVNSTPPPPRLIVNLTSNSLVSRTFIPWLNTLFRKHPDAADLFLFQISEIDLYNNLDAALDFCKGLDELHLKKTICHFGCAVKPFEYLAELKPEHVKLDISVISDLLYREPKINTVRKLVSRLHRHKCLVVAPQIEVMELLPLLWEEGIDYAQGYCLQKPSHKMNYEFTEEEEITLDAFQPH